jgi:hypothetical protein
VTLGILIPALVICGEILAIGFAVSLYSRRTKTLLNAAICSLALFASLAICFAGEFLLPRFLSPSGCGSTRIDHSYYPDHELIVLEAAIAVTAILFAPAGFFSWLFITRPAASRRWQERNMLILGFLPSAFVAGLVVWCTPAFANVFASFDAALPWQTEFLICSYRWILLLPLAVLIFGLTQRGDRRSTTVFVGMGSSAVFFVFAIWAVYSPIFFLC